jgi:hypothetical protein
LFGFGDGGSIAPFASFEKVFLYNQKEFEAIQKHFLHQKFDHYIANNS